MNNDNIREDYRLKATLSYGDIKTKGVVCFVYLPKKINDQILLKFVITQKQKLKFGHPHTFSMHAELKELGGNRTQVIIESSKIYLENLKWTQWSQDITEITFHGKPSELKITRFIGQEIDKSEKKKKIKGELWFTPNSMLSPDKFLLYIYTGEVKLQGKTTKRQFKLGKGFNLNFDEYYIHSREKEGVTTSFPILVAEFEIPREMLKELKTFSSIDDFLLLNSFATRQSIVCTGWSLTDRPKFITYYRRDIVIPKLERIHDSNDYLVYSENYFNFIEHAYKSFYDSEHKELIKLAINLLFAAKKSTFPTGYLQLFIALESLVMITRIDNDLEFNIEPSKMEPVFNEIKKMIKGHPLLSKNKEVRKNIYEKLPELNRISFRSAFEVFSTEHNLYLEDLWPVVSNENGISLVRIRDYITHAKPFNTKQFRLMFTAYQHLGWIVERSILRVLDFPIDETRVGHKGDLGSMIAYENWETDRDELTQLLKNSI